MTLRDYTESDRSAVEALHAQMGMDYEFPDIDSPLFIVRKVYEDAGRIVGVEFLKLQAEAYLMLDCGLDVLEKTKVIAHLSRSTEKEATAVGIETIVAYIPADIDKKFWKRLKLLGWGRAHEKWFTWIRELV